VKINLTAGVPAEIFTLADPYRVVIELPGVAFELPAGTGEPKSIAKLSAAEAGSASAQPHVQAFRYGAFADGRSRMVFDTAVPVAVLDATFRKSGTGVQLQFALKEIDAESFGAGTGATRTARLPEGRSDNLLEGRSDNLPNGLPNALFPGPQPRDATNKAVETSPLPGQSPVRTKPLIMIDPGHGGVDPGAIGVANKTTEKSVVLAVAWQLKRVLDGTGRFETRLTRSTDIFIPLDKRVQISDEARPDLFISLHADAIDDNSARGVTGASIYTLSDKASDEQARKMAEKENAADLVAGIGRRNTEPPDEVRGILSDLWARENSAFAHLLQKSLVGSLARMKALGRTPERSAAFRVLRQSHAPAVLIELGFLSNPVEEAKLASPAWQKQIAGSVANAVETYFERRKLSANSGPGLPSVGGLPP
jgi:N-acetylmuramoyl-L-alanine amidase